MKNLSNTETELKKRVVYKKKRVDASESSYDDESGYFFFTMWIRKDKKMKKVTKCLEQK